MAILLYVTPQEVTQNTVLGGNVDRDKYTFCIESVQDMVIEPLLGTELKDKIDTDLAASSLSGLYLELFTDYIKPITKFEAAAQYLEIAPYQVDNGGVYKHAPANAESVDTDEVQNLANLYHARADSYVQRFNKWICKNPLTEYKTYQDEVNAIKIQRSGGWYLPNEIDYEQKYRDLEL
jgi:hypothetical protein